MPEIIVTIAAIIGGIYVVAAFGDVLFGQPRASNGQFASRRTTIVEESVKAGIVISVLIVLLYVLL